jgi:hypothetical protein
MDRKERVNLDRAAMARKALTKAGYLTGEETAEDWPKGWEDIAISFLTDIMHLAASQKGEIFVRSSVHIAETANANFEKEGGVFRTT